MQDFRNRHGGCSRTLLEFWLFGSCCVFSRKHSELTRRTFVSCMQTRAFLLLGIWSPDWLVLRASFIILTVCRRYIFFWANSPHQHSDVISSNAWDMPQMNSNLNCYRKHYFRKVASSQTGLLVLEWAQWYGIPQGAGEKRGCNDDSHHHSIYLYFCSAEPARVRH